MEVPLLAYNNSIAADANNDVRAKAERLWTAKIELQRLIKTVERAGRAFLVAVVEDTWLLPLKEEATFYNKVPLQDFCAHLKVSSGGLEAITTALPPRHSCRSSHQNDTTTVKT